jgi:DHA1 family bicyclomycin/chloramphenicol resistance-like MFS transporter
VVRDFLTGNAAARMMSQQMLVMGVAPILAPTLGGFLLAYTGWQAIFWFQVGFGVLALVLIARFLPESMPMEHRVRLDIAGQLARYRGIVTERGFLSHTLIAGFSAVAIFSYLGGAPIVYSKMFGFSPVQSGMMFGTNAGSFIVFTQINGALVHRVGGARLLQVGTWLFAIAGVVTALTCWTGWGGPWGIALPMTVMVAATGLSMPNTAVGAMARHAMQAGSASALMGTMQYSMGALSGALVTFAADGSAKPMGTMMLVAAVGGLISETQRPKN